MFWGGLRGAISLALALSLTADSFGPGVGAQLQSMTFGAVLFTLLVQGTTIERLIKRLGLAKKSKRQIEKERHLGHYYAARAAQEELDRLHRAGIVSGSIWEAMSEAQGEELTGRDQEMRDLLNRYPELSMDLAIQARYAMLRAERTALAEAVRQDVISEEVQDEMLESLDARLEVLNLIAERSNIITTLDAEDKEGGQA
jgi:CPA1 family monovalent cation:H+ antiporter